jgi:hypothetical protein
MPLIRIYQYNKIYSLNTPTCLEFQNFIIKSVLLTDTLPTIIQELSVHH